MRYLMITSYPPMKCGIGTYAFQMAKKLQSEGHVVNIFSPAEGNGDFSKNYKGSFKLLHILKYAFFFEKIIFQYHQSFFYDDSSGKNLLSIIQTHVSFFLIFLTLSNKVEIIIHETPIPYRNQLLYWLERLKWHLCPRITFHTKKEVDAFESCYFRLPPNKYILQEHSKYFNKFRDLSLKDARLELNLPLEKLIFLCIGFIQPHKGFDTAIRAFSRNSSKMHLYIVGSLRINFEPFIEYLQNLKNISQGANNIHVVESYLSDEDFDTWLIASDVVVAPYREICSSGVVARAKLFDKTVIVSHVGGLSEQITKDDFIYENEDELKSIFGSFENKIDREDR